MSIEEANVWQSVALVNALCLLAFEIVTTQTQEWLYSQFIDNWQKGVEKKKKKKRKKRKEIDKSWLVSTIISSKEEIDTHLPLISKNYRDLRENSVFFAPKCLWITIMWFLYWWDTGHKCAFTNCFPTWLDKMKNKKERRKYWITCWSILKENTSLQQQQ